jgi:hypothetical protein
LLPARCVRWNTENAVFRFYFNNGKVRGDKTIYVSAFIVHPDWDRDHDQHTADIAIAELKANVEVQHVCLNTPSDPIQSFAGRNAKVYSWKYTEGDSGFVSELRDVEVPLVEQRLCNTSSPTLNGTKDTLFCAGARDAETVPCKGNIVP